MADQNPAVRRYLEQFEAGLRGLPAAERQDIVREIESHIAEAVSAGSSVADVLVRLGAAERLARAYTADAILSGPGRPWRKSAAAASVLAASSIASLVVIPLLAFLGLVFIIGGATSVVGNALYLMLGHPVPGLGYTHFPMWQEPGLGQWLGIPLSVVIGLLGVGAFTLLKRYMLFLIGTIRRTVG
ncbi:MAG TPA: DUF1700 domain-containing protein [Symbiobacteriaceae bacterium]|nr:DUF1700 domain-containing protein [Symbiobacteriaceae bacterium]